LRIYEDLRKLKNQFYLFYIFSLASNNFYTIDLNFSLSLPTKIGPIAI
jgi:hypothetical protein